MKNRMTGYRVIKTWLAGILVLLAFGCNEEEPEIIREYTLAVLSGNNQQGTVTLDLNYPLILQVADQFDEPGTDQWIYLETMQGSLEADSLKTDSLGIARVHWNLGPEEGAQQFTAWLEEEGMEVSRVSGEAMANTFGFFTDERDYREYKFVKIGEQFWMAENLDYGVRINGYKDADPENEEIEKYYYDNDPEKGATYGGLYQWEEMMQGSGATEELISTVQGVCPAGWHVPSYNEWYDMIKLVKFNIPSKLKSQEGWNVIMEADTVRWDFNGTDDYGFRALGSGYRHYETTDEGSFYLTEGVYTYFWTATEYDWDIKMATAIGIYGPPPDIPDAGPVDKRFGFPIRCVKDPS